jgi:predicted transcriptional regulator
MMDVPTLVVEQTERDEMTKRTLGDEELKLLRFVAEHGPLSVGEVADQFGASEGLARSTVLTMMERLRKKRYLKRRRDGGVFRYVSPLPYAELLKGIVQTFVDTALAGSLSPFVAYLAGSSKLSRDEVAQLERLAARLEEREKEKP